MTTQSQPIIVSFDSVIYTTAVRVNGLEISKIEHFHLGLKQFYLTAKHRIALTATASIVYRGRRLAMNGGRSL